MTDVMQLLKRCEVFIGLNDNELKKVSALPSWRRNQYNAGDFVFRENTEAKDFFIMEDGLLRLVVSYQNGNLDKLNQIPIDIITRGDVFGWSSIVSPHLSTMSAICVEASSVIMVNGAELKALLDDNKAMGYEVMQGLIRVIGKRLRDLRRFINEEKPLIA